MCLRRVLDNFQVHSGIALFNWKDSPVTFGLLTGAYEGIGTVIPIETSMHGSRHLYPRLLRISLIILSIILGGFGSSAYLRFGPGVSQVIIGELPAHQLLASIVRAALLVGISFTYPLQLFPVVQVAEVRLLGRSLSQEPDRPPLSGAEELLTTVEVGSPGPDHALDTTPSEKVPLLINSAGVSHQMALDASPISTGLMLRSCLLRTCIVFGTAGIAVIFRNYFSYFGR